MKLIIGLGNPGFKYLRTRHNAGFIALDVLQATLGLPEFSFKKNLQAEITKNNEYILVKPQTFMNESGRAVRAVLDFFKDKITQPLDENIIVLHDDLDIAFGEYKVQKNKSPKVHNGIQSVQSYLGIEHFWYARLGIDGRNGDRSIPGHSYVLQNFSLEEEATFKRILLESIVPEIVEKIS